MLKELQIVDHVDDLNAAPKSGLNFERIAFLVAVWAPYLDLLAPARKSSLQPTNADQDQHNSSRLATMAANDDGLSLIALPAKRETAR